MQTAATRPWKRIIRQPAHLGSGDRPIWGWTHRPITGGPTPRKQQRRHRSECCDASGPSRQAKKWKDIWAAIQGLQAIRSSEPVATAVEQLEREYREALARVADLRQVRAETRA